MKTLKELKEFCNTCNVRYEISPKETEYYNEWSGKFEKFVVGYYFGMNNISGRKGEQEWQWVWFESIGDELKEETPFYFSKRYSMVNGKTYKGFREEFNQLRTMDSRMARLSN